MCEEMTDGVYSYAYQEAIVHERNLLLETTISIALLIFCI